MEFYQVGEDDCPIASFTIRAGYGGEPRALRNHIALELELAKDQLQTARLIKDYLATLVRCWVPESLSAHTYAFMKAQGWKAPQISVGWDNFISNAIALDESVLAPTIHLEHADGGAYFTLDGTPAEPSLDQSRLVRTALGYE
ncbi:hypothetical protein [Gordonia sp. NPDC003429]